MEIFGKGAEKNAEVVNGLAMFANDSAHICSRYFDRDLIHCSFGYTKRLGFGQKGGQ